MDESEFEERVLLFLDKVDRDIATHGMSVIGVFDNPPFSYTVGLHNQGFPELILVGMEPKQAHGILTSAYIALKEGRTYIEEGVMCDGVLVDYPVKFVSIPDDRYPLTIARRYHRSDDFPAFQLIWPDEGGRFPGDEGYAYSLDRQQLPTEDV